MSNLTRMLRDYSEGPSSYWSPICDEAADKIDELEAELKNTREYYESVIRDGSKRIEGLEARLKYYTANPSTKDSE